MVLGLPGGSVDTWSDIAPCTVVKRLLLHKRSSQARKAKVVRVTYLTPEKIGIGVLIEVGSELKGKEVSIPSH